jgi:CRP-like cAMP-binding protein
MVATFDPGLLRSFTALTDLSGQDLLQMAEHLQYTKFRAGAQLCREGDEGDGCYFLATGSVSVTKNLPDGRRVHLATLPEGTLFGQSGLVPGQLRTADVKAEGNVEVLVLSRRQLEWGLRQKHPWAVIVQTVVAVALVRQLRSALDRLESLAADENAADAAKGKTRASIPKPQGLDVKISKRPPPPLEEKPAATTIPSATPLEQTMPAPNPDPELDLGLGAVADGEEEWKGLPPIPDEDDTMSTQGLLCLLAETESSIAGIGLDLDDSLQFVQDEDMRRTSEARQRN